LGAFRREVAPLLLLAAYALLPWLGADGHALTLAARAMIFGLGALGVALLVAGAGLVSLGHAATLGVGAYAVAAAAEYAPGTDAAMLLPAAMLLAGGFAALTGLAALRTGGVQFIMITLAFGQMAFFLAGSLTVFNGDDGVSLFGRSPLLGTRALDGRLGLHFAALALLTLGWLLCRTVLLSRFGRVLRAARESPERVRALGFEPYPYRLAAYALAGALGGAAGVLQAEAAEFVSPATLGWQRSGELLFMVILGGAGGLPGAMWGAAAFVLLEEWLSGITEHWRIVFGPLLILSVLWLRGGLLGLPDGLRRLRRRPGPAPRDAAGDAST